MADETFQEKMVVWIQVLVVEDEKKCMDLRWYVRQETLGKDHI